MKKLILLASIIILLAQASHAQTKTPLKEQYQFKGEKPITVNITFTVPVGMLDSYITVIQSGGAEGLSQSDKISAKMASDLIKIHQVVLDSLNLHVYKIYTDYVKKDRAKFTADTTLKYHPPKK